MLPRTWIKFRAREKKDILASALGAALLLGLALWGAIRLFQMEPDVGNYPTPDWHGEAAGAPGFVGVFLMSLFGLAFAWRAISKHELVYGKMSRSKYFRFVRSIRSWLRFQRHR